MLFWERFYRMCEIRGTKPNPLAKELGISSGAVTRWKNAEDPPSGKTLMLLADKLDCSVDYLLGRTHSVFSVFEKGGVYTPPGTTLEITSLPANR